MKTIDKTNEKTSTKTRMTIIIDKDLKWLFKVRVNQNQIGMTKVLTDMIKDYCGVKDDTKKQVS